MKKLIILLLMGLFATLAICIDANAAKKSKKSSLAPEVITQMSEDIDRITKKIYGNALISPEDNQSLINVKIQLDNQMLQSSNVELAPLYFKAGSIYVLREMNKEAIDCFQTILENFGDTALAPKARAQLKALGVEVKEPEQLINAPKDGESGEE